MQTTRSTPLVEPPRDRVGGEARRHEDHGGVRPGGLHRVVDRVEDRDAVDLLAALARGDARRPPGCRRPCCASRGSAPSRPVMPCTTSLVIALTRMLMPAAPASSTARRAAESIVDSTTTLPARARPGSPGPPPRWCRPGARRSAASAPRRSSAVSRPSATSSQRVIPPKMLISSTATFGSLSRTSRAVTTSSAFEPPPASRKLAGRPPASATTSRVLITRPAPLPRMPTSPSSLT